MHTHIHHSLPSPLPQSSVFLSVHLSLHLCTCLSVCVCLSIYLPIYPSMHPSTCLPTSLPAYLSNSISLIKIILKNRKTWFRQHLYLEQLATKKLVTSHSDIQSTIYSETVTILTVCCIFSPV